MLYRKITSYIEDYLKSDTDKILILEGARQIGKSFSIREAGTRLYPNYVEINFVEDDEGDQLFKNIHKKEDFYLTLSMVAGDRLSGRDGTLVFLDEIQHYPQYLTMLKFLRVYCILTSVGILTLFVLLRGLSQGKLCSYHLNHHRDSYIWSLDTSC